MQVLEGTWEEVKEHDAELAGRHVTLIVAEPTSPEQLKGGYKPMAAVIHAGGAIPVIGDNDCPNSRLFFINTSSIKLADVVGTDWADMDGAVFDRVVDKDAIDPKKIVDACQRPKLKE